MKFSSILITFFILIGCNVTNSLNFEQFNYLAKTKKTIILSCTNCSCVIDELNTFFSNNKFDTSIYKLYSDTVCIKNLNSNIKTTHLNQVSIDSLSMDFYNILLITYENKKYKYKIIETKYSTKINSYLKVD